MNRRQFLWLLSASPLAFLIPALHTEKRYSVGNSLYTIGSNYQSGEKNSLVTRIDIESDQVTQKVIPIKWGHLLDHFKTNEVLAAGYKSDPLLVLDSMSLKLKRPIKLPENYLSSGHFKVHNGKLYVGLYPKNGYRGEAKAALAIFDLKTEKQITVLTFSTQKCHDINILDDNHIIVSLLPNKNEKGFLFPPSKGKLALIHSRKNSVLGEVEIQVNGSPEHMGVFNKNHIFVGITQYIPLKEKELLKKQFGATDEQILKNLNSTSLRQGRVGINSPLMQYNFKGQTLSQPEKLFLYSGEQKKLLSFALDNENQIMYVTCGHSNSLIAFSPKTGEMIKTWKGLEFGLESIQGVAVVNGGNVALSGDLQGVTIFNPKTSKTLKSYKVKLYSSTHLTI